MLLFFGIMDRKQLVDKINKGGYSKEQLISWVNSVQTSTESRKPSKNKIGDVYMSPIFQHPYILLEKKGDSWLCGLMTSNEHFPDNLCECQSRFFEGKFITKTLFIATELKGSFLNTYDNNKQLKEVLRQLKQIL